MSYLERMYELVEAYGLPEIPEEGQGDRELFISVFKGESEVIAEDVTLEDAQEYCSREDTHVAGEWFVGFRRQ